MVFPAVEVVGAEGLPTLGAHRFGGAGQAVAAVGAINIGITKPLKLLVSLRIVTRFAYHVNILTSKVSEYPSICGIVRRVTPNINVRNFLFRIDPNRITIL